MKIRRWTARFFWLVISVAFAVGGCGHARVYGVPGATQRSPDLALPLSTADAARALLALDNQTPPRGGWSEEEAAEVLARVAATTRQRFAPLLQGLERSSPSPSDLAAGGAIGHLFDPPGANDEALDARFHGDVLAGDLRVARRGEYLFVFYRRYPGATRDESCPRRGAEDSYCRLVIVREVATRRD